MYQKWILPPEIEAGGLLYSFSFVGHGQLRMKIMGLATVPGKGECQPWLKYRNRITELYIEEGVSRIGERAFAGYGWLERVWLPSSMQELGYQAFGCCPNLQEIIYTGSIAELDKVRMDNALPEQFYLKE